MGLVDCRVGAYGVVNNTSRCWTSASNRLMPWTFLGKKPTLYSQPHQWSHSSRDKSHEYYPKAELAVFPHAFLRVPLGQNSSTTKHSVGHLPRTGWRHEHSWAKSPLYSQLHQWSHSYRDKSHEYYPKAELAVFPHTFLRVPLGQNCSTTKYSIAKTS